jgi:glutamate/tyrosine decarboxylase-like PLP-dependent enzyme
MKIPKSGKPYSDVLAAMAALRDDDLDYRAGKSWSLVYYVDDDYYDFLKQAHNQFFSENGLNPMAFKSLKTMESEVVRMTASMLHGDSDSVGTMTSGGTESILLAMKAYRDRARKKKPWILRPEVIAPATAHVAFDKAAHYFGFRLRRAAVDSSGQVDLSAVKKLINRHTIALVGSAPQYPHGTVDPIDALGTLAQRRGLPLHVDACFGGFILPWLEKIGCPIPAWDFRVPGVTSISADLHKYGYAAKGASTIIYRDMTYLTHQFFITTDWCGGIYASPSMAGTRSGGPIAAAWAALNAMGEDGYIRLARGAWETTEALRRGIEAMPELRLLGLPHATVVTYASADDEVDLYAVADQLAQHGWDVGRQQHPASIHLTVNSYNAIAVRQYLDDLGAAVAVVKADPSLKRSGEAAMYGMMAKVPMRGLVQHSVRKVMESMYAPGGGAPDMAALGSDDDDGFVLGLIHKYGDQAQQALDRFDAAKGRLRRLIGRNPG